MGKKIKVSVVTALLLASLSCSTARSPNSPANANVANTGSAPSSGSTTSSQNSSPSTASTAVKSIYTDLTGCGPAKTTSEISSETTCGGIEGYKLLIQTDDDRDSITVITPDGQKHPLDFWQKISKGAFAALGQKAEWRVANQNGKDVPIALIVRVDVQGEKKTSYLAVSRISDKSICVTDRIDPSADANEKARIAADASANKPCLK